MNINEPEIKPNILVVDDMKENLFLIEVILKNLDVNLILAGSGLEALSKIKDVEIALALLDIRMPKMDGVELAEKIQNDNSKEKIPIIFITAYPKEEIELEKYYESGAVYFIQKPFKKNILLSKVKVFMELYRQKQQLRKQKLKIENTANKLEESNQSLNKRFAHENLLSKISGMAVLVDDIGDFLVACLSASGETLDLCRSFIFEYKHVTKTIDNTYEWCNKGVTPHKEYLQGVSSSLIPYWAEKLRSGQILNFSDIEDIPAEGIRNVLRSQNVLSILAIPLFVKGNYYGFMEFSDCLKHREWTGQDVKFLLSISRIIVAVIERKLTENELLSSKNRYQSLFDYSPVPLWEEDFTELYFYLESLKKEGVMDFRAYFEKNPETLQLCSQKIKIMDVNRATLKLHEAKTKEELFANLDKLFTKKSFDVFKEEIIAFAEGELEFETEAEVKTLTGKIKQILIRLRYDTEHPGKFTALLATPDITVRKQAEEELKNSLQQLQQLTKYVEKVREEERVAISRELHDDLGQALTAVKIDLGIIRQSALGKEIEQRIIKTASLVRDTIKTVQKITFQLRPKIIDDLGLEAGIDWYTKEFSERNGIEIILDIDPDVVISSDVSIVVFRIMQESLTNISRHAKATQIDIQLSKNNNNNIIFLITDNGIGISESQLKLKTSFGIIGMKERAHSIGGTLDIYNHGLGTTTKLIFPLNEL